MNGAAADAQKHVQAARVRQGMTSLPTATSSNHKPRLPGLPPTPPHPTFQSADVDPAAPGLPPRKAHRRSRSDVPFGYFAPHKVEADDLLNVYLNLEGLDGLNNSSDGDSRGSSSIKTNGADGSENEYEEGAAADRRERLKMGAAGEPPVPRHARSLSMDSLIVGKFNFSAGGTSAAANGIVRGANAFSLEFGSGEFTPAEMKKIMADEKLAEMALADPKRVKKVLANRQSAARSKERKMRYIAELEQKVQILQKEATKLSAQLTLLQRDSAAIATQNNELKFWLQDMEQQAQLRDALNEVLTAEVQRLKLATAELGDSCSSNNLAQQIQLNVKNQMFQLQQQSGEAKNHESKE